MPNEHHNLVARIATRLYAQVKSDVLDHEVNDTPPKDDHDHDHDLLHSVDFRFVHLFVREAVFGRHNIARELSRRLGGTGDTLAEAVDEITMAAYSEVTDVGAREFDAAAFARAFWSRAQKLAVVLWRTRLDGTPQRVAAIRASHDPTEGVYRISDPALSSAAAVVEHYVTFGDRERRSLDFVEEGLAEFRV